MHGHEAAREGVGLGVVLVLGAILLTACSSPGFSCEQDDQCTLAGEPGLCVAGGRCAYPDPQCPSGLAFPQGASMNAGECVPSEAVTTDTDAGTQTGTTGEPMGSSTDPSSSTTRADDSEAPPGCGDPHEPNDDEEAAAVVAVGDAEGCLTTWDAFLESPLDADWYVLDTRGGACVTSSELTFVTEPPLELCALPRCPDGLPAVVAACDGSLVELTSGEACCGTQQIRVTMTCNVSEPEVRLGIATSMDTPACLPYEAAALQ